MKQQVYKVINHIKHMTRLERLVIELIVVILVFVIQVYFATMEYGIKEIFEYAFGLTIGVAITLLVVEINKHTK